jgi:hypothetical protein
MLSGGTRPLLALANEYIIESLGSSLPYVPDWNEHLSSILVDTGLVYWVGRDLRFVHQTVAEYLAATVDRKLERLDLDPYEIWTF